jgi:signal transduction histidine kinase
VQPGLTVDNNLPHGLVSAFFVLNIAAVSLISFAVLHLFLSDRRRLRALEVAFLNQELALRQSEKMATLGTLAAGVAHELNNPAAAARRASEQLRDAVDRFELAHVGAGVPPLTAEGRELLQSLERPAREAAGRPGDLDALERSDRESAVGEWLNEHGVAEAWEFAPSLVDQGLDLPALSKLADALEPEALAAVLVRAASAFPVYRLVHEIGEASGRISEIVAALKSYSFLGQAPAQAVDLHEGLDNTLVILRAKLKDGVDVHRDYSPELPPVPVYGSDLNQVWTNLLDNAIDAMNGKGTITIRTRRDGDWAVVEIEDDGPGIPEAVRARIFDPFFTTKQPGSGTGLGLSTSYSIVTEKHHGRISVESEPGLTRFTVSLPLTVALAAAPNTLPVDAPV